MESKDEAPGNRMNEPRRANGKNLDMIWWTKQRLSNYCKPTLFPLRDDDPESPDNRRGVSEGSIKIADSNARLTGR